MAVEWGRGEGKGVTYLHVSVGIWEETKKGRQTGICFLDFSNNGVIKKL